MSDANAGKDALVGWQGSANIRGTYSILQSCLGTVVLLCWSSVCPNVPPLGVGSWRRARGKLTLFFLAILMPEAVLFIAAGQLRKAWLDRNAFRDRIISRSSTMSGYSPSFSTIPSYTKPTPEAWGLRQCFFVNMGGLFVQFSPEANHSQPRPFPVTCKQLRHLVYEGFLDLPAITPSQIEMRNKSSGLSRTITIVQVLWFTITTLARTAEGLPITTLELTTLSMVLVMVVSALLWWRKPMDISHPIIIACDVPLSAVLATIPDADPRVRSFGATPLAFYDRKEWIISKMWASYMNILRAMFLPAKQDKHGDGHTDFPNAFSSIDLAPMESTPVGLGIEALSGLLTQAYCCVLLAAWNLYFPTQAEKMLWRASTAAGVGFGFLGCALGVLDRYGTNMGQAFRNLWRWLRKAAGATSTKKEPEIPLIEEKVAVLEKQTTETAAGWLSCLPLRRLSNLSPGRDPSLDLPLHAWIPATLICMVYCFARAYIIIEDIISLRRQPQSTYQVVSWGQYGILF